jgi:hypothetical protein
LREENTISGMSAFTLFHILLSLVGIATGFVVAFGLLLAKHWRGWTAAFLSTTVLTSLTGFLFPVHHFMPSHGVGIVSLIALALAIYALYVRRLAGAWRRVYVIDAVIALYLNFFVLIVQTFQKVPDLKALAPTQTEAPFNVTQLTALVVFALLGIFATRRFRNEQLRQRDPSRSRSRITRHFILGVRRVQYEVVEASEQRRSRTPPLVRSPPGRGRKRNEECQK